MKKIFVQTLYWEHGLLNRILSFPCPKNKIFLFYTLLSKDGSISRSRTSSPHHLLLHLLKLLVG